MAVLLKVHVFWGMTMSDKYSLGFEGFLQGRAVQQE